MRVESEVTCSAGFLGTCAGRLGSTINTAATMATAPAQVKKDAHPWDRALLEGLITKRFFYNPSFEIYGGASTSRLLLRL